jgi:hypothetical protein
MMRYLDDLSQKLEFEKITRPIYWLFLPLAKTCSPRNTILDHAIGILCGFGTYVITGAGA